MPQSALERTFETRWLQLGAGYLPPISEYRFHPSRNWRFDFCWIHHGVAVELEGAVWTGGRHTRGSGFTADCAKYNAAAEGGWLVLRFTGNMIEDDPIGVINQIKRVLDYREREFKNGRSAAPTQPPHTATPKTSRNRAGTKPGDGSKPRGTDKSPSGKRRPPRGAGKKANS